MARVEHLRRTHRLIRTLLNHEVIDADSRPQSKLCFLPVKEVSRIGQRRVWVVEKVPREVGQLSGEPRQPLDEGTEFVGDEGGTVLVAMDAQTGVAAFAIAVDVLEGQPAE